MKRRFPVWWQGELIVLSIRLASTLQFPGKIPLARMPERLPMRPDRRFELCDLRTKT